MQRFLRTGTECFCLLYKHNELMLHPKRSGGSQRKEMGVVIPSGANDAVPRPLLVSMIPTETQVTLHTPPLFMSFKMVHQLSGLFLLLVDLSLICGQTTQKNSVELGGQTTQKNSLAFEDSNSTYEDQEDFQDQELYHHYDHCNEEFLMAAGEKYCLVHFNESMTGLGEENWCNVEMIVRSYHELTECLETLSRFAGCYYPNRVVEKLFVAIHQRHFHSCSDEEELTDAPAEVVLAATLLPIILIPFIVYIVVWKSSLRD